MRTESPCFECSERAVGCHAQCEKYKKYSVLSKIDRRRRNADMARHSIYKPVSTTLERLNNRKRYVSKYKK